MNRRQRKKKGVFSFSDNLRKLRKYLKSSSLKPVFKQSLLCEINAEVVDKDSRKLNIDVKISRGEK